MADARHIVLVHIVPNDDSHRLFPLAVWLGMKPLVYPGAVFDPVTDAGELVEVISFTPHSTHSRRKALLKCTEGDPAAVVFPGQSYDTTATYIGLPEAGSPLALAGSFIGTGGSPAWDD